MVDKAEFNELLADLREVLGRVAKFRLGHKEHDESIADRDRVIARYKPIFSVEHIPDLSKEEFTSFLYFENNRHWSGLYRKGLQAAEDMNQLKEGLNILLDESQPIRIRFQDALARVLGLGKGIATGILTIAYPDTYGVWNSTSEAALRQYRLWPVSEHGEGVGGRYEKINAILARLRLDLGIDFWTLDTMWWSLPGPKTPGNSEPNAEKAVAAPVKNAASWEETPRTFIAYSREDSSFALRLAKDLKSSGVPVWLDQLHIKPGQRWDNVVTEALTACSRVLVLLSPSSIVSEVVTDEFSLALDENKTVIPILCGECTIPFRLRRLQHIDFRAEYDTGLRKLVETLCIIL